MNMTDETDAWKKIADKEKEASNNNGTLLNDTARNSSLVSFYQKIYSN
jgi:hypothetical protein